MAAKGNVKGVIFDMDGVLVDTAGFHLRSWHDLAKEKGLRMTDEFFARTFGMQNHEILPLMAEAPLSPAELEELSKWKEQRYRELISGKVVLLEGVAELLGDLVRSGFALALGSSAPEENVELILTSTSLTDLFAHKVTAADTSRSKPAPDTFLLAARKLGLAPARCVVVEDAIAGVKAGKAAQMAVVAVTNTCARQELQLADRVVDSLAELTAGDFEELLDGRVPRPCV